MGTMSRTLAVVLAAGSVVIAKEFEEVNGVVSMEAENATSISSGWKRIDGGLQDNGSGSVDFKVTFHKTGRYFLHVRGATGAGGCGNDLENDCFIKFDGNYLNLLDYSGPLKAIGLRWPNRTCLQMQWQQGPKLDQDHHADSRSLSSRPVYANVKSAGTHTLSIIHRSKGLMIDKTVLLLEKTNHPSGAGPDETVLGSTRAVVGRAATTVRPRGTVRFFTLDGRRDAEQRLRSSSCVYIRLAGGGMDRLANVGTGR